MKRYRLNYKKFIAFSLCTVPLLLSACEKSDSMEGAAINLELQSIMSSKEAGLFSSIGIVKTNQRKEMEGCKFISSMENLAGTSLQVNNQTLPVAVYQGDYYIPIEKLIGYKYKSSDNTEYEISDAYLIDPVKNGFVLGSEFLLYKVSLTGSNNSNQFCYIYIPKKDQQSQRLYTFWSKEDDFEKIDYSTINTQEHEEICNNIFAEETQDGIVHYIPLGCFTKYNGFIPPMEVTIENNNLVLTGKSYEGEDEQKLNKDIYNQSYIGTISYKGHDGKIFTTTTGEDLRINYLDVIEYLPTQVELNDIFDEVLKTYERVYPESNTPYINDFAKNNLDSVGGLVGEEKKFFESIYNRVKKDKEKELEEKFKKLSKKFNESGNISEDILKSAASNWYTKLIRINANKPLSYDERVQEKNRIFDSILNLTDENIDNALGDDHLSDFERAVLKRMISYNQDNKEDEVEMSNKELLEKAFYDEYIKRKTEKE